MTLRSFLKAVGLGALMPSVAWSLPAEPRKIAVKKRTRQIDFQFVPAIALAEDGQYWEGNQIIGTVFEHSGDGRLPMNAGHMYGGGEGVKWVRFESRPLKGRMSDLMPVIKNKLVKAVLRQVNEHCDNHPEDFVPITHFHNYLFVP